MIGGEPKQRAITNKSSLAEPLFQFHQEQIETQAATSRECYAVIAERNAFHLKPIASPIAPPAAQPEPTVPPKEDLVLTGLVGFGANRSALFMVNEPGKPADYFTLHQGEVNEWLEVRSIDLESGTVKAVLKKPVVRIRNTETEVVLSFQVHGNRTTQ